MFQVLIIEDDPMTQKVLVRTLRDQGYEVTAVGNGEEGLLRAQQLRPALIICDWMMPGMSGLEVCQQVKADPALSTTFFMMLTSRAELNDRVKGLDTGADDFLSKPFEINELKARIRAGLRLHQLSQDLQTQKQILEAELAEAAEYVRSLLPAPMTEPVQITAQFLPSRYLGGDCFDYYWLDADSLVIYLLDVSGHGVGSALLSVSVQNLLRSQSLPGVQFHQPTEVLRALNETFQMTTQNDRYFTIWYGVYQRSNRELVYASAGHPPAILLPQTGTHAEVKRLKTPGVAIGMFPNGRYVSERCAIEGASTLYVFSDGAYETNQLDNPNWNLEALINLLVTAKNHHQPAPLQEILHRIRRISARETFEDDFSLLQVNFD